MEEKPAIKNLSYSALLDVKRSAFRFWRKRIDPNKPEKKVTEFMLFGDLLHVLVLQPEIFDERFTLGFDKSKYSDILDTTEELKARCAALGLATSGTKPVLIGRIKSVAPDTIFYDEEKNKFLSENQGKKIITEKQFRDAKFLASYIMAHPDASQHLNSPTAQKELRVEWVSKFGIPMVGIIDQIDRNDKWGNILLEVKTFSNPRGKTLDEIVADKFASDHHPLQYATYEEAVLQRYNIKIDWFCTIFAETGDFPHVIVRYTKADTLAILQGKQLYEETSRRFLKYLDKFGTDTAWIDDAQYGRVFQDEEFPIWTFK